MVDITYSNSFCQMVTYQESHTPNVHRTDIICEEKYTGKDKALLQGIYHYVSEECHVVALILKLCLNSLRQ